MNDPSPTRRFFGGMMMAVGGLIAVLCGLCTGGFQVVFLYNAWRSWYRSPPQAHELVFPVLLPLLFGALPILVGVGLFFLGRWMYRPRRGTAR